MRSENNKTLERILNSFRSHEIVDEGQITELKRWKLLDFESELDDEYVSKSFIITVCGCGRSGTTLTRVLLDSHSLLYSGPESLLFLPIKVNLEELAYKFALDFEKLVELSPWLESRAKFIDEFQKLVLSSSGKSVWVDKTARNVHRLGYILKYFPKAKIIHVIRDPRDVVASLKTHKKRKIQEGNIVPTGYCMPVNLCIERWELAITDALKYRNLGNYIEIRYEDLVLDVKSTVRRLCEFVGVDYEPDMLNFHSIESSTRDYRKFPQNIEATKPLSQSSIGRHKTVLTADEIAMVEERLGKYMELFDYPKTPRPRQLFSGFKVRSKAQDIVVVPSRIVNELIGANPLLVKQWMKEVLEIHYQGQFIQPPKTYLITSDNPYDRIIALPAYIKGEKGAAGIKWIGSHCGNYAKGLDRANAVIVLNDTETHAPTIVMDGSLISTMRTFAMSLIAMDRFAPKPSSVGIIGMGKLGRMHVEFLADLYPTIERINCFSARAPFNDLLFSPRVRKYENVKDLVKNSEVIITVTAAREPYIFEEDLSQETRLIVNTSLMDFDLEVILSSDCIIVDDWLQNTKAQKVFKRGVDEGRLKRDRVLEMGEVLYGPRRNYPGRVFVNPLGMGLDDVYVGSQIARSLGYYPISVTLRKTEKVASWKPMPDRGVTAV